MASCKDCLHYDLCKSTIMNSAIIKRLNGFIKLDEAKGQVIKEYYESCNHFQDRSRFVELPFQLGDNVYCMRMFKIYKKTVNKIELDDDGLAIVTEDGYCLDSTICFRSQEEAEQALKEREENAN